MRNQGINPIPHCNKKKYLGINLPEETKELYTENYNTDEQNQR